MLDFNYFETNNLKTLGIQDGSLYDPSIPIVKPVLKVYVPGFTECAIVKFAPNMVNILNSNNLGLTNTNKSENLVNLPDGIYSIEYSFTPYASNNISKKIFRTSELSNKFMRLILNLVTPCENKKSYLNDLRKIEFYIYGSIANAATCKFKEAITLYNEAEKIIDKYLSKCL